MTLRLGRQEMQYGAARLVSVRVSPNVRLSFDGARLIYRARGWRADTFVVEPVRTNIGVFDDVPDSQQQFWGVYTTGPLIEDVLSLDVYYLGLERADAEFEQGTAREQRHTLGARLWGNVEAFDFDAEYLRQVGTFGIGSINAWGGTARIGYTVDRVRFAFRVGATSGDRDPANPDLQTHDPLFPTGRYFSEAALLGPLNHIDIHPRIELQVTSELLITADTVLFWRESTTDALYTIAGMPQVAGTLTSARYLGTQPSLELAWQASKNASLHAAYVHFFVGPFLARSGAGHDIDFLALWADYRI
jgi:hypothetical protein